MCLWQAKRWLDSRGLKMAPEKTEASLIRDRRSFQYPRIIFGEHEVEWKTSIKYLGIQLDRRFGFGEHLKIAAAKAIQCGANLVRLMQTGRWSRSLPPAWTESTGKSAFIWRKRSQAMSVLTRTWGALRRRTRRCVVTAMSLWIMQSTHSSPAQNGV